MQEHNYLVLKSGINQTKHEIKINRKRGKELTDPQKIGIYREIIKLIREMEDKMSEKDNKSCTWIDMGIKWNHYSTDCGWLVSKSRISGNWKYCPYCGDSMCIFNEKDLK